MPEDKPKPYMVGTPICDECGKYRPIIITILERKETHYGYELIKRNLCIYHFAKMLDTYDDKYPNEVPDDMKGNNNDDDDGEPDEPEDPEDPNDDDEGYETKVICERTDCVWNQIGETLGECQRADLKLINMGEDKDNLPLLTCDSYLAKESKMGKIVTFIYRLNHNL